MITHVTINNYKSILNASVPLSPFTLLVGANGTGKSNFLQLLRDISKALKGSIGSKVSLIKHINSPSSEHDFSFINDKGSTLTITNAVKQSKLPELEDVSVFALNPTNAGQGEQLVQQPVVHEDGSGVVQVLDSLKTGEREDLFDTIESALKQYIPEIEKLSFIPGQTVKQLQVREKYLEEPIPVNHLSEGTQLTLMILTILYQERPPSLVCIEEIDRSLHPRLFGQIVQLCCDMAKKDNMPQIVATTHNPYLVDQFKDNEAAVVIVEKEQGHTIFTTLEERLQHLEAEEEYPLGALWYSGFVGGVPKKGVFMSGTLTRHHKNEGIVPADSRVRPGNGEQGCSSVRVFS